MITLILNRTKIIPLATDPNWIVPEFVTFAGKNYETRKKDVNGTVITYSLTDSGVTQD